MKNVFFSVLVFLFCFSVSDSAFGQEQQKDTAYFDFSIQDYVVYFDVSEENPNTSIPPRIFFPQQKNVLDNTGWDYGYPAEFRDGKIYLSHPSQISLRPDVGSYCYARFYNESRDSKETNQLTIDPPDLKCMFDWDILDKKVFATANVFGMGGLNPSIKYFAVVDPYADLGTQYLRNLEADYDGDKTFKAVGDFQDLDSDIPKYIFLNFYIELKDSLGITRVEQFFDNKVLILFKKSQLFVKNIVSEGAFSPHWNSYAPENAKIRNLNGEIVFEFVANSGESYYFPDNTPTGYYSLEVGDMDAKLIFKYHR